MLLYICLIIFVSSAGISLARRIDSGSAVGRIAALQGTTQSIERRSGTNRTQSHRVGSMIANRYILVQELENRHYGHGAPVVPKDVYNAHTKLGKGGYATAYKATDTNGHEDVVLKIMNEDTADDEWSQQLTFDECQAMQALQRKELVQIFPDGARKLMRCIVNNIKVGQTGLGNGQFIVIEYGGVALRKDYKLGVNIGFRKDRGKHIVSVVNQTLRGIVYLAGLGVAHRDLTPDNILVQYDESGNANVKIIDFGVVAHGKDVHCDGSRCNRQDLQTACTGGVDGTAVCEHPSIPTPSESCSFKWEEYAFAPPEMRHDNQRVCLTPDYPVDAFDVWSMGQTVFKLVSMRFDGDDPIGDGFRGDAPDDWKEWFLTRTYLGSNSGRLLYEFCISALQSNYSTRGRVVALLNMFDPNFEAINFPELQGPLVPVTPRNPTNHPEANTEEGLGAEGLAAFFAWLLRRLREMVLK